MKNIFLKLAMIMAMSTNAPAQIIKQNAPNISLNMDPYVYYLNKSKEVHFLGKLLFKGGAFLTIVGINDIMNYPFVGLGGYGYFITTLGGMAVLASIPVKLSSAQNSKQAALYYRSEKLSLYHAPGNTNYSIPSVGISLSIPDKKKGKKSRKENLWQMPDSSQSGLQ